MPQEQEVAQPKKKKALTFDAGAVFSLPDRSDDLELNLDEETARYRAEKGEAGDRGFGGDGNPNTLCRLLMESVYRAYAIPVGTPIEAIVNGTWDPATAGEKNKVYG